MTNLPKTQDLIKPLLNALQDGNLASNAEIRDRVAKSLNLDSQSIQLIHSGARTEFEYRLAWARTNCKARGWITSPKRMYWQITGSGKNQA